MTRRFPTVNTMSTKFASVCDQMGRSVRIPVVVEDTPSTESACIDHHHGGLRIISLVPSQTELLHDLGVDVVGITNFCKYPNEWRTTKPKIGGTKKVDHAKIHALHPDLILGNKEENEKSDIELLEKEYPVWMSDIYNLEDALEMIRQVGALLQVTEAAETLVDEILRQFQKLPSMPLTSSHDSSVPRRTSAAYLIWRNPYMVVASDTFIDDMLRRSGYDNIFADKTRYPIVSLADLETLQPDVIFLSSEPYRFQKSHVEEFKKASRNVKLVDGEMFSWYGSRLRYSPDYFQSMAKSKIP
jgi:ABC-type Fe3+-hydroxamate transport system substrate-binding protein